MSADLDDDFEDDPTGLEDEPVDCYTAFATVEIVTPEGQQADTLTHDVELLFDHNPSTAEIERAARAQVSPWVGALVASPRFKNRFGTQPTIIVTSAGVQHGC